MNHYVRAMGSACRRLLHDATTIRRAAIRDWSKLWASKSRSAVKPERLDPSHIESGQTSEGRQRSSRNRSSRAGESLRSGSRFSPASSDAAQVALNVMRQLQEQQAAFQE
ncbi:hypothetical protein ON010_g16413 [Phytophthora cinnamomi]|nr:hypothetical protein ON010_g16413 [Phytophthora cinnamomi]